MIMGLIANMTKHIYNDYHCYHPQAITGCSKASELLLERSISPFPVASDLDRGPVNISVYREDTKIQAQDQDSYTDLEVASHVKIRPQTLDRQVPHVNLSHFSLSIRSTKPNRLTGIDVNRPIVTCNSLLLGTITYM